MGSAKDQVHVVVGIESLPEDRAVLHRAANLARRLGGSLDVFHAAGVPDAVPVSGLAGPPITAPPPGVDVFAEQGAACRAAVAEELPHDEAPPWDVHVAAGEALGLLELAEEVDAYCLVVGTRGEGLGAFLGRLADPSVSHALIRDGSRPVMIVPPDAQTT